MLLAQSPMDLPLLDRHAPGGGHGRDCFQNISSMSVALDEERMRIWAEARRILCIRLDSLGDVLMTEPAIRAIKGSGPDREITLLTSPAGSAAAGLITEVDFLLTYTAPWMKSQKPATDATSFQAMVKILREARFDAAVIFTVYSQNPLPSAMMCYLAEIPLRLAHCHENPYQLLTDWIRDPEPQEILRHEVRRQLDLVAAVGCRSNHEKLVVQISQEARQYVRKVLQSLHIGSADPWILIHPGASAASRRYPAEHFVRVVRRLVEDHGFQIVLTGTEDEQDLVETIQSEIRSGVHTLVDQFDLQGFAALIEAAPLVISNNTGPVHIAAAVGTPVVVLYALTNPQHTPWHVPNRVLYHDTDCKYCYKSVCPEKHHNCLRLVQPEEVVEAACDLWLERQGAKQHVYAGN
jgi:lipopolysaccharide heptosyltransferase II